MHTVISNGNEFFEGNKAKKRKRKWEKKIGTGWGERRKLVQ